MNIANARPSGLKCGVVYKGRPPCNQVAGHGTNHVGVGPCRFHGGLLNGPVIRGRRDLAEYRAERALATFGEARTDADPEEALLALVSEAAGNVAFLGNQVRELSERPSDDPEGSAFTATGLWRNAGRGYSKGRHLFGPRIDVDKYGVEHVVGEEERAMVKLYGQWADRLAKYAKAALDAGIEKRRVEMAEQQGEHIVIVVNNVLVRLGMSSEKLAAARTMIAEEFRQLGSGGEEG